MNFSDVFKSSFLREFSGSMGAVDVAVNLLLAAAVGLYIFLVYRFVNRKQAVNQNYCTALWVLTVIIAAIIITISTNIVLSLGMVGALSIIRYRTAIKDPIDLVFLFWAIAEGIMCGAGMIFLTGIVAVLVTAGVLMLSKMPKPQPMRIMTVNASSYHCEEAVMETVKKYCKTVAVRSRNASAGGLNLVLEISGEGEVACTGELMALEGVYSISSLAHDGEVTY